MDITTETTETTENKPNVFNISVQNSLEKLTNLPDVSVWDRIMCSEHFVCDRLAVQISTNGFFRRETCWMSCFSILSRRSHFVIYVKENLCKGYVVNLARAKKIKISTGKFDNNIENFDSLGKSRKFCLITIKWSFGTIHINLNERQTTIWRHRLLDSQDISSENSSANITSDNSGRDSSGGSNSIPNSTERVFLRSVNQPQMTTTSNTVETLQYMNEQQLTSV